MALVSTWTAETLAPLLGGARGSAATDTLTEVARHLSTAVDLLEPLIGDTAPVIRPVPDTVADELVLRVVRALWDGRKSATGQQFTENGGPAAPRAPRDPLAACEAILARYVVPL